MDACACVAWCAHGGSVKPAEIVEGGMYRGHYGGNLRWSSYRKVISVDETLGVVFDIYHIGNWTTPSFVREEKPRRPSCSLRTFAAWAKEKVE